MFCNSFSGTAGFLRNSDNARSIASSRERVSSRPAGVTCASCFSFSSVTMERSPSKIKFSSISVYSLSCLFFFFFFFLRLQSISSSDGADGETSNKLNKPPIEGLSFLCGVCSGAKIDAETICCRLFSAVSIPAFPKCLSSLEKLKLRSISEPLNV